MLCTHVYIKNNMGITTIADSIGIAVWKEDGTLLTSIGNELHIHLPKEGQLKSSTAGQINSKLKPRLIDSKVHGIVVGTCQNEDKLIVYGGQEFMVIAWCDTKHEFIVLHSAQLTDWINAALFLVDDEGQFILHTSHSVVIRYSYRNVEENYENAMNAYEICESASCEDKSTLYTSHLHGSKWEEVIVFSGNAMGELLIWQPSRRNMSSASNGGSISLLHRIAAHNGVIFSIDYNAHKCLLTTTSDDRSIKFWRVDGRLSNNNDASKFDWSSAILQPFIVGYGHSARVFCGKIIEYNEQPYAITVGEDSYFCLWHGNGELIYKRRHHFGATIWNFAYDALRKTLYTVGSTGNVLSFGLQDLLEKPQQCVACDTLPSLQNSSEYVAKVKFIANDVLIGITNKNRLIYAEIAENTYQVQSWKQVKDFASYKSTGLDVSTMRRGTMVALYGFKRLTLYEFDRQNLNFEQCFDDDLMPGVIRAFHFLNAETFLVSDAIGNCLILKGKDFSQRIAIKLPICKERWLTMALLTPDERFLLTSNRNGNIMLYQRCINAASYELKQNLRQLHGYHGATVLNLMQSTDDAFYIRSAGHDGKLNLLCINKSQANLEIYTQHQIPVTWVEAIHKIESDDGGKNNEIVIGFNDNHFVAWSFENDFLLQLPCGGSHRCWHYSLKQDESTGTHHIQLVFIRQKQVMYKRMRLYNECHSDLTLPTRNFWHVRPCNALAVFSDIIDGKPIIISAGDDNFVKIFALSSVGGQLELLHELHTHISNVRCVRILNVHEKEYLIFSGGGRAQLCISKLNMRTGHVQEISNYTINDFDGKILNNNEDDNDDDDDDDEDDFVEDGKDKQSYKFNAETRIMTLDVVPKTCASANDGGSGEVYQIYLGCSNGYLVLLEWQPAVAHYTPEKYKTLCNVNFERCLLQVRLIADLVLVTCTDGILHFYNSDLSLNCFELKLHKSGINALDVELLKNEYDEEILEVLTGGDDAAVFCTQFKLSQIVDITKSRVQSYKKHNFENLHFAQVTAAALFWRSNVNPPELIALTSGVDQTLIEYNLTTQRQKRIFRSCVADIKGLCVATGKSKPMRCYLYGCGLQIIDL